jgi:hypothetical protein
MRIEMKNISASDARYGTGRLAPIAWDYQFSVTDAKGHELPMTRYGQYLMDRSGDIFSDPKKTITIKPGESVVREVCINRIRDMTMEGKYKIVVRTSVPYGESVPFDLASAPLEIEVKEPEARDKAADADAKAEKAEPAEE